MRVLDYVVGAETHEYGFLSRLVIEGSANSSWASISQTYSTNCDLLHKFRMLKCNFVCLVRFEEMHQCQFDCF